jgi:hypothetical protein
MPPRCDSLDGAFDLTRKARNQGSESRQVADLYFFDTVVRVHSWGEGAPHTGLKPAGLDVGPVIPLAGAAVDSGDAERLIAFLQRAVRAALQQRLLADVRTRAADAATGIPAARTYTSAMLGFLVVAPAVACHRTAARPLTPPVERGVDYGGLRPGYVKCRARRVEPARSRCRVGHEASYRSGQGGKHGTAHICIAR